MKKRIDIHLVIVAFLIFLPSIVFGWPVPDTGQTQSYAGTFGEDSDYRINPRSFTKLDYNGNDLPDSAASWAMVRDNVTGLIWEVKTDDGSIHDKDNEYSWVDAKDVFVATLNSSNFGTYSDWRLPSIKELATLYDHGKATTAIDETFFQNIDPNTWYVSSTPNTLSDEVDVVFMIQFSPQGGVFSGWSSSTPVLAVRGQRSLMQPKFWDNGDGTVTDMNTGLMWQRSEFWADDGWTDAIQACEDLVYSGYSDWRLPNINELQSLADYKAIGSVVDTRYFDFYRSCSSTTDSGNTGYALNFWEDGQLVSEDKDVARRTRAVRGGQPVLYSHLYITDPEQGAVWIVGSDVTIKWDTAFIGGNVRISLSRDGGLSYKTITESTENSGSFQWNVSGPISVNCALKIEALSDISKSTVQSLFSIWFEDQDADWMPDDWEVENDLNPNAADGLIDSDGDKFANLLEYRYGTAPNDPSSHPSFAGPNGRVPDTGLSYSYTNTAGEDSDYQINPPQFVKVDSQGVFLPNEANDWVMIFDTVTGLYWETKTDDGFIHDKDNHYTWYDPNPETNGGYGGTPGDGNDTKDFIDALNQSNFGGFSDWRMPTVKEMYFLLDKSVADTGLNSRFFRQDFVSDYWWTGTASAQDNLYAWTVNTSFFNAAQMSKSASYYVRAVRGRWNSKEKTLVDNRDGTITDTGSGLMWQKQEAGQVMDWENALSYCSNLSLPTVDGYSDWRLPSINELQSIAEFSKPGPLYDTTLFGDSPSPFWSSTTRPGSSGDALGGIGEIGGSGKNTSWPVRAVRGGQMLSRDKITIAFPLQGSIFKIGETVPIRWSVDSQYATVDILLSRDGGESGSFEAIAMGTENDGQFSWTVTGPISPNCMLRIEPASNPDAGNSVSFFSVDEIRSGYIVAEEITPLEEYRLSFYAVYHYAGDEAIDVPFAVSDPGVGDLSGDLLTAAGNGPVVVSAEYQGETFTEAVYLKTGVDDYEMEPNNTEADADSMSEDTFMMGDLPADDIDWFVFSTVKNTPVEIAFFSESATADVDIQLYSEDGSLLASTTSVDGQNVRFAAGLYAGSYRIKLSSAGDVDQNAFYQLIYSGALYESGDLLVEFEPNDTGDTATDLPQEVPMEGGFGKSWDNDFYRFEVKVPSFLSLDFECPDSDKGFAISIYKSSSAYLINELTVQNGDPVSFPLGLSEGTYLVAIEPADSADFENSRQYRIRLSPLSATNLEIESNNTYLFANPIAKDQIKKGRIFSADDTDYYGFHLPEQTVFDVYFTPSSITADYRVSFVDKEDSEFYPKTSTDGEPLVLRANLSSGNYYVKVVANGDVDSLGAYEIYATPAFDPTKEILAINSLAGISIDAAADSIGAGEQVELSALAHYYDTTSEPLASVEWTSLNPDIAAVDAAGTVTGSSDGQATIVAAYQGHAARQDICVGAATCAAAQHHGSLILVAGGGVAADNTLKESTQYLADLVYRRFARRLFRDEDIYYFNPMAWRDINGDGFPDNVVDDDSPTLAEFEQAITGWAADQSTDGPLYVYLIDHGGTDSFKIFPNEIVTAAELKGYLDTFQAQTGRQAVVMIEACKSGTFTDDLIAAGKDRIAVTCTDADDAYLNDDGTISFTQFFVDNLLMGNDVAKSWNKARVELYNQGPPYDAMNPQLEEGISTAASQIMVGGSFVIASLFPEIAAQSGNMTIDANTAQTFFLKLSDLEGIDRVWAVVLPPDYTPPDTTADFEAPQVALPSFELTDPEQDGRFEGTYSDFPYTADYRITFYAQNVDGNLTVSPATIVTVQNGTLLLVSPTPTPYGEVPTNHTDPFLDWNDISAAVSYTLEYADNAEFTGATVVSGIVASEYTLSGGASLAEGTWYWRVKAVDSGGTETEYSTADTFTVGYYPGDVNLDRELTLSDAILALQIAAGMDTGGAASNPGTALESGGSVGIDEAIFILQGEAALR